MANAARGASAREVTAVLPYLAYARQDRKSKGREPVSAQAVLGILAVTGVDRIVTVDPHSPQVQLGFRGPFDQLIAEPILQEELSREIAAHDADYMVIAPDAGRVSIAQHYSNNLTVMTQAGQDGRLVGFDFMSKRRLPNGTVEHQAPKGVAGKACIVVDDMIDTAGTLISATEKLYEAGADRIIVAATHGLFSGEALSKIAQSALKRIIVTDTVPQQRALDTLGPDRLQVLSIAPLIGQALIEIVTDGSVSKLFKGHQQYS
jgi:ribose-phosphate pyrophosphokinase